MALENNNPQQPLPSQPNGLTWTTPTSAPAPKPMTPPTPVSVQKALIPPAPAAAKNGGAGKVIAWLVLGILVGVLIAWGISTARNNPGAAAPTTQTQDQAQQQLQNSTEPSSESPAAAPGTPAPGPGSDAALTVMTPQPAGSEVSIAKVVVAQPTWVVVYESRNGKPGNVLGAGLFFAGEQSGTVTLLRGTTAGQTYFVAKYTDNGDHKFSLADDTLQSGGAMQWVSFDAQ